ncbi:MAG: RdgB/HAM1 family non-canonical purine NTP pyrophosphatase [Arenicella sp.]
MSNQVVLASSNQGKIAELQDKLTPLGYQILAQSEFDYEDAVEDGLSFVENAIIKARHACEHTGLPAIADDSGLEVAALQGAPGIYSARYAGDQATDDDNNAKLLSALANETNRSARFQCALVFMRHAKDPTPIICQGNWHGKIVEQTQGNNGFGYDPLFYIPELKLTSAQLSPEHKQQISHRAQALKQLISLLPAH